MSIASRGPVSMKETVQISRTIDFDGFGTPNRVSFSREIFWIRECEYNISLFHRDVLVKESISLGDGMSAFLSSLDAAVYEAASEAAYYRIPLGHDGLEVRLTVIVKDVPLLRREDQEFSSAKDLHWYDSIPRDWSRIVDGAPYPVERQDLSAAQVGLVAVGGFQEKTIAKIDIWSSNRPKEANAASVEEFRSAYRIKENCVA